MKSRTSSTFEKIEDALTEGGCPVCAMGKRAGHNYLNNLVFENVNNVAVRKRLMSTLGMCGRHSRQMLTFPGGRPGISTLEQSFMEEALKLLRTYRGDMPTPRRRRMAGLIKYIEDEIFSSRRPVPSDQDKHYTCEVCQYEVNAEKAACEVVLENLTELEAGLREAGGLCVPHLEWALLKGNKPTQAQLVTIHEELWESLIGDLKEFVRKNDYKHSHEQISEAEGTAAERAIQILTGHNPKN